MNRTVYFAGVLFAGFVSTVLAFGSQHAVSGAETGTLKIRFKYKGNAPGVRNIVPVGRILGGQAFIPDEGLLVHPKNNGIKNVMVYVYTGRRGAELPPMNLNAQLHTLVSRGCRFEPHVLIAKAGDTIQVANLDPFGLNTNFQFFANANVNLNVPPAGVVNVAVPRAVPRAEPAAIPVACNIHPWMQAHVLVLDHPFAAASDENGLLEINGLPVGEEIVFRASHERGSFKKFWLNGEEESWRANKFAVEIKAGENDLGTVELDAAAFQ